MPEEGGGRRMEEGSESKVRAFHYPILPNLLLLQVDSTHSPPSSAGKVVVLRSRLEVFL